MLGKKSYELTLDDIKRHPIWVLAMDLASPDDEDWDDVTSLVVPLPDDPTVRRRLFRDCNLHVRTKLVAASERAFLGLIKLSDEATVEYDAPSILTGEGWVDFYWTINKPSPDDITASYRRLQISAAELFPLRYEPDTPVPYGSAGGVLEGFYYLELRGRDEEIKSVR